jgi:phenylalanyl-tRNA synthetase beta chain
LKKIAEEQFDHLCFEFGIELDDVVVENNQTVYKIEIPANRYDLLCVEGLSRALAIFLEKYYYFRFIELV